MRIVNKHAQRGTYFFDYGNAFLLESSRAGADILAENGLEFKYPSYVQDIMGPMCFDLGFGPFRWVCASGDSKDLRETDRIAGAVLEEMAEQAPPEIEQQLRDNIRWIRSAERKSAGGGLHGADPLCRLCRTHPDRTRIQPGHPRRAYRSCDPGKRSPRCVGHGFTLPGNEQHLRWIPIYSRHGHTQCDRRWLQRGQLGQHPQRWWRWLGRGERRFGMLLDGSDASDSRLEKMLFFDVNNGIARRSGRAMKAPFSQ